MTHEWGTDLIKSWNTAGWFTLPQRVGDKIAPVIGAQPGEVIAGWSALAMCSAAASTLNRLIEVLSAAITSPGWAPMTGAILSTNGAPT